MQALTHRRRRSSGKPARDPERHEKAQAEEERQALLFAEHPEAGRALEEHLTRYYRRWLDMPLPALRGETPRAAAQSDEGRSGVRALVDDLERIETGKPAYMPRLDLGWIRRALGLA